MDFAGRDVMHYFRPAHSIRPEIRLAISVCWPALSTLFIFGPPLTAAPATPGVSDTPCPLGAIAIEPGASIQVAVDSADHGAVFCLKNGVHRAQLVRPRSGQKFYGEGRTVLNGSRLLTNFNLEGRYWVASEQFQRGRRHGECIRTAPACNLPEGVYIDDKPLTQVLSKDHLESNEFYFDYANRKIYLAVDPTNRMVEATVAAFAFESVASDVLISNITVEKYASVAQKGAIQSSEATGWTIQKTEVRLNSGAGIGIGSGGRVVDCDIHHNGQIGIAGHGADIAIEENRIWSNNIHGFDPAWEAGGAKIALSDGVTFRGNHVFDNRGAGLWCDIDCRNVVYDGNLVENNQEAGIFHEISFKAVIRNNVVRNNGKGNRRWFWGAEISVAASQDVEVMNNTLTVAAGGCGIVLIDQGRLTKDGRKYKTRNNIVHDNDLTFEGAACGGGVSGVSYFDANYAIITDGNNRFDRNVYRVPRTSEPARFVWGHTVTDWDGFRRQRLEQNGQLLFTDEAPKIAPNKP
jgi:Right handed beta helix region